MSAAAASVGLLVVLILTGAWLSIRKRFRAGKKADLTQLPGPPRWIDW